MAAIIKHHVDYQACRCEQSKHIDRKIDGTDRPDKSMKPITYREVISDSKSLSLSQHDKTVLDAAMTLFTDCDYVGGESQSRRDTNNWLRIFLNESGVLTAKSQQWSTKHLQNFRHRLSHRREAVADYLESQTSVGSSHTARMMDDSEMFDVNVSHRLDIASCEANHIDNISRRKNNLSTDVDYNHKPDSNRGRFNAEFIDYRATRYLIAAE